MYYQIFSKIYERAAKKMCFACQDFIKKGSKILDLGCGSAIVGNEFKDFFQAEVIGVDIVDRRILNLPFKIYDGRDLPFPEKSFDIVLLNYVLHHCQDPLALLKEAKRVVRDKIVIFEDLPEGFFSNLICKIHDLTFTKFFQHQNHSLSFKSEKEWEIIFRDLGLNIIYKKRRDNFPLKKELFVLGLSL